MYLASGLPGLPGYQAPPTRPNQALPRPSPTRTYQNPALPGLGFPKDDTLDHIHFWQPPKTPPKQHTFSDAHLKKQCKMYVSLKSPKIGKTNASKFCLPTADLPKTYILHCKMYVFDSGASISSLES